MERFRALKGLPGAPILVNLRPVFFLRTFTSGFEIYGWRAFLRILCLILMGVFLGGCNGFM